MKWIVFFYVASALALAGCGETVSAAEGNPSDSASKKARSRPDRFEFRFEDWKYSRASGRGLTEMKVGGLTLALRGEATDGDTTTRFRASIVVGPRSSFMSLSFPKAGFSCKGMPGSEHGLDIVLESKDAVRGTVSGEMKCVETATRAATWVRISGAFDAEGL